MTMLARAGRRSKITPELLERVGRLAALGLAQKHIAEACNVTPEHFSRWVTKGRQDDTQTSLEYQLWQVFHEATVQGEMRLVQRIAEGDTKDAQWLLSRSPRWRARWSENSAVTRAFREGISMAIEGLQAAGLTPEQERNALLWISAKTGERLVETEAD
jgi:hypothetical protein